MDDHRSPDALTEATLDREIQIALAVEPSPEFLTRVRTSISSDRVRSFSPLQWELGAAAVVAIAVIVFAVIVSRPDRKKTLASTNSLEAAKTPVVAISQAPLVASSSLSERPVVRSGSPAPRSRVTGIGASRARQRPDPEIIIAADEAAAFRRLMSNVRRGRVDLALVPEHAAASVELQLLSEISIPPIALGPVEPSTAAEGERQ